jgi:hypothetical protein
MDEVAWFRHRGVRVRWRDLRGYTSGDVMWDGNMSGNYADHCRVAVTWDETSVPEGVGPRRNWVPVKELVRLPPSSRPGIEDEMRDA